MSNQKLERAVSRAEGLTAARLVRVLGEADALLAALKHYHKLGRYSPKFPEKPYFLFSQCGRLLYDFEIAREHCELSTEPENDHFLRLLSRINFERLRDFDYARKMAIPSNEARQFKNESEWYRFWFEVVEATGHLADTDLIELYRSLLDCVGAHGVLVAQLDKSKRKAVTRLFQGTVAGRLIINSEWILEDVSTTIMCWLAKLDARQHVGTQLQAMGIALRQVRRHILWNATATGPYRLTARSRWGLPSGLSRYRLRGTQGLLAAAVRDDGGAVTCTFTGQRHSRSQQVSWVTNATSLQDDYEKTLFETWSYDTGERIDAPKESPAAPASWRIETVEGSYLDFVSQRADTLASALIQHPACSQLARSVQQQLREIQKERGSENIRWTFIKDVDALIRKIESLEHPAVS